LLKDGHTNVYPVHTLPTDSPALVLEPIDGKPVATVVGKLPELRRLSPGMELLEIDGTPVETIVARDIDPYISSSTIQDRQLQRSRRLLQGPPDSHVETTWRSPGGKIVKAELLRNRSANPEALKIASHERFEFKELSGHIGYIGLNDFSNPAIVTSFEAKLPRLLEEEAWIIDLRRNGGGSSDIGYRILAHFIDAPTEGSTWRTREYKPSFEAWGEPQTFYEGDPEKIEPAAGPRYKGPI
jgi:carboxyl-terminal processing protease